MLNQQTTSKCKAFIAVHNSAPPHLPLSRPSHRHEFLVLHDSIMIYSLGFQFYGCFDCSKCSKWVCCGRDVATPACILASWQHMGCFQYSRGIFEVFHTVFLTPQPNRSINSLESFRAKDGQFFIFYFNTVCVFIFFKFIIITENVKQIRVHFLMARRWQ